MWSGFFWKKHIPWNWLLGATPRARRLVEPGSDLIRVRRSSCAKKIKRTEIRKNEEDRIKRPGRPDEETCQKAVCHDKTPLERSKRHPCQSEANKNFKGFRLGWVARFLVGLALLGSVGGVRVFSSSSTCRLDAINHCPSGCNLSFGSEDIPVSHWHVGNGSMITEMTMASSSTSWSSLGLACNLDFVGEFAWLLKLCAQLAAGALTTEAYKFRRQATLRFQLLLWFLLEVLALFWGVCCVGGGAVAGGWGIF